MGKVKNWLGLDTPKPPKPPPVPDPAELEGAARAAAEEALRKRRRGGRGSTILTSGLGVTGYAAPTYRKTLLGQ